MTFFSFVYDSSLPFKQFFSTIFFYSGLQHNLNRLLYSSVSFDVWLNLLFCFCNSYLIATVKSWIFYAWSMQIRMFLTYFLHIVDSLFFQNKFTHREPLCMFVPRIVMRFVLHLVLATRCFMAFTAASACPFDCG